MLKRNVVLVVVVILSLLMSATAFAAEVKFDFEDGVQGWAGQEASGGDYHEGGTAVAHEKAIVGDGSGSLKVTLKAEEEKFSVLGPKDQVHPGDTVTVYVYFPEDTTMKGFQIFRQDSGWDWQNSTWVNAEAGKWNKAEWTIPAGAEPFNKFGLQFLAKDGEKVTKDEYVYVDSNYNPDNKPAAPAEEPAEDGSEDAPAENPETGVAGALPYMLLAGASSLVLIKKRRVK